MADTDARTRCAWAEGPLLQPYHDKEWGVPVHDDRRLFEFLLLEGAQAGLSWTTILKKRAGYEDAFLGYDPQAVAQMTAEDQDRLRGNANIVRNRAKIASSVTNARAFIEVQTAFGSFDAYLWGFVDGAPIVNQWNAFKDIPARTGLSDILSKDLMQRGFKFVGSTICYAYLQAVGLVNDHTVDCFRHQEVADIR